MPKAKSRKIVLKRFRITKTKKIKRKASNTSHLNRKDSKNAEYRKKRELIVVGAFAKKVKKMIYAKK